MDDGGVGGVPMRASASLRDVAAVAAAVEAAEARLSALSAVGAPACDDDEPQQAPTMRVRSLSSPRANHVRRAAPDPSAALLLSVRDKKAPHLACFAPRRPRQHRLQRVARRWQRSA
jgi:hypothetical protein